MRSYMIDELSEFINEYREYKALNNNENLKLIKLYKITNNLEYKNKIILGNIRLVVHVVLKYHYTDVQIYKIDIRDLINIGIIGLSEGIDRFDISRSTCVTSVITNYIRRDIGNEINRYKNIINCPIWLNNIKYKINKAFLFYINENNSLPSLQDLSKLTKININNIINLYELHYTDNFISFDIDKEDKDEELLNTVSNEILDDEQYIKYLKIENKLLFNKILNCLTEKQQIILKKLIDLSHGLYKNHDEIAKELKVTNQNISIMFKLIVKKVKYLVDSKQIENIFQL